MTKREVYLMERSTPEPNTGCWLWLGAFKGAYPGEGSGKGESVYVNRETLHLRSREQFACHKCDQKACVNPQHIYAGDRLRNAKDWITRSVHHNTKKQTCPRGHVYDTKVWNGKYWARSCTKCRNHINRK